MSEDRTKAERTADNVLELMRARVVVEAARAALEAPDAEREQLGILWLSTSLDYYEGKISYEQYQSFLTDHVTKSPDRKK